MATTDKWLEFTVHLTNKAIVDDYQTRYPSGAKNVSPEALAAIFAAPIQETDDKFVAPCIRSPYFIPSSAYPRDVATFERKSGGWFGLSFLFGDTTRYHWYAKWAYVASTTPEVGGTPTEVVAIAQRRFLVGFDYPEGLEAGSVGAVPSASVNRGASRHADGQGFAVRLDGTQEWAMIATANGAPSAAQAWERFYIRVNKAPTIAAARCFRIKLATGASRGFSLNITTDLRIQFNNIQDGGSEAAMGSSTEQLTLGQWHRIDVLHKSGATATNQTRVYIGRKLVLTVVVSASGGMNNNSNHENSYLGAGSGWATGETAEMDFDDWVCSDWPTEDSSGEYVGLDWLNGSRVVTVPLSAIGPGNSWTGGDYRQMNANCQNAAVVDATARFTSSVSGDPLVGTIQATRLDAVRGALGAVAFYVCFFVRQTVAGSGTFGWRFDGLLDLAAITQSATARWERRLYRPSGLTEPIADLTPLEMHHIKALNVNPADCYAMAVVAELIGTFGDEDVPQDDEETVTPASVPARVGIHNAPYPETPWAYATTPVQSPVVVHSGTYTGNGSAQELVFRSNVNWLFIRRVGSAVAGQMWLSTTEGAHFEGARAVNTNLMAMVDPSFTPSGVEDTQEQRCIVRVIGDSVAYNQAAVTYEYIAVMDPGSRFMLNGQFSHDPGNATFANALIDASFTPEYTLFHLELLSSTASTYSRYVKGLGHAAPNGSILNAAESTTIAQVAAGVITSLATLHVNEQTPAAFSAWRRDDGSSDPNRYKVVKIGFYTGDGAASRTISFENPTGLRPLFAIVTPHNATSFYRDPSNLTNTSNSLSNGVQSTTAITAGGIDSMTLGITLNANGIVYEYKVLLGSATAGNGGWSIDGEFAYVEPDWIDPEFTEPPDFDEDEEPVDPDPDPGEDDEDDCDAGEVCVAATTRVVNQALLEIGSSKVLTNYCTQDTIEAATARILYEPSVRATLHAFPWPFATKYAALALAVTQPSNQDWLYSYRQPTDCIFERRIVVARNGAVDPTPPPFELSSDASGGLIFTNEPNAVLEYTMRPACVAFTGDPLFREALKWHFSAAMAPPITRMKDKAEYCHGKFKECIERANAIVRPGDPGLRVAPTWQANDAGVGAMAANLAVANLALLKIGARTIASLASTDQSREAIAVNLLFEHELRATLRDYPWKFAKRYDDALVLVGGTDTDPVNPDWQYSYRLPADNIMARRLVTEGTGRSFDRHPTTFEVGTDATGGLLFTGEDEPLLEYTARIDDAVLRSDDLFREALGWRLAAALAPSLAQADPERQEQPGRGPDHPPDPAQRISHKPNKAAMRAQVARVAFAMYLRAIEKARVQDANEAQPEKDGEAEWIEGRS